MSHIQQHMRIEKDKTSRHTTPIAWNRFNDDINNLVLTINPTSTPIPKTSINQRVDYRAYHPIHVCDIMYYDIPLTGCLETSAQIIAKNYDNAIHIPLTSINLAENRLFVNSHISYVYCQLVKIHGVAILPDPSTIRCIKRFISEFTSHVCDADITAKIIILLWLKGILNLANYILDNYDANESSNRLNLLKHNLLLTVTPLICGIDKDSLPNTVGSIAQLFRVANVNSKILQLASISQKQFIQSLTKHPIVQVLKEEPTPIDTETSELTTVRITTLYNGPSAHTSKCKQPPEETQRKPYVFSNVLPAHQSIANDYVQYVHDYIPRLEHYLRRHMFYTEYKKRKTKLGDRRTTDDCDLITQFR
jgi:hypothetical protein